MLLISKTARVTLLLTCSAFVLASVGISAGNIDPPPDCLPGDSDGSGGVDIDDVVYTLCLIFGDLEWVSCEEPEFWCCADADGSCHVDIDDVVYTIHYIFGGGPGIPESCANCGPF